jgi:hypothetical protein
VLKLKLIILSANVNKPVILERIKSRRKAGGRKEYLLPVCSFTIPVSQKMTILAVLVKLIFRKNQMQCDEEKIK